MATSARSSERFVVPAYALALGGFVAALSRTPPHDDALFFKRLALNFLEHGVFAWNVQDGPVHGSTSQLFQAVSVLLTAVGGGHTLLATRAFSAACLLAAFAALFSLTRRRDGGAALAVAFVSPAVLFTAVSGMETALVLCLLSVTLVLVLGERQPRRAATVALLFLVWLARPDALLPVLPVFVAVRVGRDGSLPLRELAVLGLLVTLSLVVFRAYYGTALPLPFYAKSRLFSPYGAHFLSVSAGSRGARLGNFALVAVPLAIVALGKRDTLQWALLAPAALFTAYHALLTVDVMGMQGRFYAPALPALVVAAARGVETTRRPFLLAIAVALTGSFLVSCGVIPSGGVRDPERVAAPLLGATILAGAFLVWRPGTATVAAALLCTALLASVAGYGFRPALPSDDAFLRSQAENVTVYRGLDVLERCLGDGIHVYHSEIGLPGLRLAHGKVSDLAGLMTPRWLFGTESIDESCAADPPHAIFLPHRHYRELNDALRDGTCLRGYERVVDESSSPLHVRRDLLARYRACEAAR